MPTTAETTTFTVQGMTCGHCASSVRDAIQPLDGVTGVAVSVRNGSVTVTTDGPVDRDAIDEAVRSAGYEVTP